VIVRTGAVVVAAIAALAAAASLGAQAPTPIGTTTGVATTLPAGPERAVVVRMCTTCHDLSIGAKQRMTRDDWAELVDNMAGRGAEGTPGEFDTVVEYLARNFGPPVNVNTAAAEDLVKAGLTKDEAAAIVKARAGHPFHSAADLVNVDGLTEKRVNELKDGLSFDLSTK
jgi:cytochrome c5